MIHVQTHKLANGRKAGAYFVNIHAPLQTAGDMRSSMSADPKTAIKRKIRRYRADPSHVYSHSSTGRRDIPEIVGFFQIRTHRHSHRKELALQSPYSQFLGTRFWGQGPMVVLRGTGAVATVVARHSRFLIMPGLPQDKKADGLPDALINRATDPPRTAHRVRPPAGARHPPHPLL